MLALQRSGASAKPSRVRIAEDKDAQVRALMGAENYGAALLLAARYGLAVFVIHLCQRPDVDVNAMCPTTGLSPLLLVCKTSGSCVGALASASALMSKGARVDVRCNGTSALGYALQQGNKDLIDLLRAKGAEE